ncbi:ABC transporter substrate-binding protein [Sneathiella sp. HT1-7]|uniref:ABC transporter substrate-binding protein n=1 Tax=Sneathiella sp. HT1-7 TaxID=2887192 RepID=UPI001D14D152|nr:ABC transporter substrate-binding protein [Sneathiella sp. HT1-7]MCC3306316.1 ABC transporter substrate-binding protein [Sneathiella sp. HT1-7]
MTKLLKQFAKVAVATLVVAGSANLALAADKEITFSGSGGVVGKVSKEVWWGPYTEATGTKINHVAAEAKRMPQLEAMVKSGNVLWDAMEVSASDYPLGVKKGLFEAIDYSLVDPDNQLPADTREEFGVAYAAYSQVLIVRTDKLPDGKKMESWADFWDVENFPGPRALRGRAEDNLEFALLADGVPAEDIYKVLSTEEGLDRAFAKLDEIKPHITTWWTSGAQSVQLLSDGEVYFCPSYNGRITTLVSSGIPAEIVWNGGAMHKSYIAIPKGTEHLKEATEYVKFRTTSADRMREYVTHLPYPGWAPGLFDGMDPKMAANMPTFPANQKVQFSASAEFWAENLDAIQERWTEWLLQ